MKRLALMLIAGMLVAASVRCRAGQACTAVTIEPRVEAGAGELTLADLLARGACPEWRAAAARVRLGGVPRSGSVRVLDGREIRRLLEELEGGVKLGKAGGMAIPERIVVKRRGATKSCAEIARFVAGAAPVEDLANVPSRWREDLDCAAARCIPEEAPLALTKTAWNAMLNRWEFGLRCARPEDCVPFMVWANANANHATAIVAGIGSVQSEAARRAAASGESSWRIRSGASGPERLVAPGQTATLTWDDAGIRVVLPVTCLDAGALGQLVRVRLKNAARILRAEVVGAGTLRASL